MTAKNYIIRRMSRQEINIAINWAEKEGWNPGLCDSDSFYVADPKGFFIGLLDGQPIAVGSAVRYDDHFAFCGFYIVSPEHRGQGYGLALTKERLAYVGKRNAGIDGVTNMLDKYSRLGYKIAHNNARYEIINLPKFAIKDTTIMPINDSLLSKLFEYDRLHFPALRKSFLNAWVKQEHNYSLAWIEDGEIKGYGVIRQCRTGFKIGPLFANSPDIADKLFRALVNNAKGDNVYLDIPENNSEARSLVKRYKMKKVFETARMYLKGQPNLKYNQIFGITTFELG